MARRSAGLLPYRRRGGTLEVFLVHPGGPYWARKDDGAWSIAKGEYAEDEEPVAAAHREFAEETGFQPTGPLIPLTTIKQPGGKFVSAWAVEFDADPARLTSTVLQMEWPRGSGRMQEFPEVDRAAWFGVDEAMRKLLAGQRPLLVELRTRLTGDSGAATDQGSLF